MDYSIVSVNEIQKKLKVRDLAVQQGYLKLPKASDTDLDAPQLSIVQHFEDILNSTRTSTLDQKQDFQEELNRIGNNMDDVVKLFQDIPKEADQKINRLLAESRDALIDARKEERTAKRNLKAFMINNELTRVPSYPESKIFHWSIVITALVVESVANSYFFSKGSDLGLLGGVLQALLISLFNIGSALFVGVYALPYMNHVERRFRSISAFGCSLYAIILLFFNLATAHYRAFLEADPVQAIILAIPHLFKNPFGINNFDAWVLFFIGGLFATFASIKGYTSDDSYPGFGREDRKYKEAEKRYKSEKQKILKRINEAIDKYHIKVIQILNETKRYSVEYRKLISNCLDIVKKFNEYSLSIEKTCNAILKYYRDINEEVRGVAPPKYFSNKYSFPDVVKCILNPDLEKEKKKAIDYENASDKYMEDAQKTEELLRRLNDLTLNNIDEFFLKIEEDADRTLKEGAGKVDLAK